VTLSPATHDWTISAHSIGTQGRTPRAHAQKLGPPLRPGALVGHRL